MAPATTTALALPWPSASRLGVAASRSATRQPASRPSPSKRHPREVLPLPRPLVLRPRKLQLPATSPPRQREAAPWAAGLPRHRVPPAPWTLEPRSPRPRAGPAPGVARPAQPKHSKGFRHERDPLAFPCVRVAACVGNAPEHSDCFRACAAHSYTSAAAGDRRGALRIEANCCLSSSAARTQIFCRSTCHTSAELQSSQIPLLQLLRPCRWQRGCALRRTRTR